MNIPHNFSEKDLHPLFSDWQRYLRVRQHSSLTNNATCESDSSIANRQWTDFVSATLASHILFNNIPRWLRHHRLLLFPTRAPTHGHVVDTPLSFTLFRRLTCTPEISSVRRYVSMSLVTSRDCHIILKITYDRHTPVYTISHRTSCITCRLLQYDSSTIYSMYVITNSSVILRTDTSVQSQLHIERNCERNYPSSLCDIFVSPCDVRTDNESILFQHCDY